VTYHISRKGEIENENIDRLEWGETKMLEPSHRLREKGVRNRSEMGTAKIKGVKKC